MILITMAILAMLLPLAPLAAYLIYRRQPVAVAMTRRVVLGLTGVNLLLALMLVGVGLTWFFAPEMAAAAGMAQESSDNIYAPVAAAFAVSAGSISAGYAVSTVGSAAIGALAEKPEVFGRALIFVGLAEGVAIYGLIIAFIILGG
ncbi:MAG: ATP synthase subunit C [Anaerolineales bacterium]